MASHFIYARASDGRVVHVRDVKGQQQCDCTCLECGEPLIAHQGGIKAWHFQHAAQSACAGGPMTALHRGAQQIIADRKVIRTPDTTVVVFLDETRIGHAFIATKQRASDITALEDYCKSRNRPYGLHVIPGAEMTLEAVELEKAAGNVIPDVTASIDARSVFIEVVVTHDVDAIKRAKLCKLGIPTMKVMLADLHHTSWDWSQLTQHTLHTPENRHWVVHPEALEKAIQAFKESARLIRLAHKERQYQERLAAMALYGRDALMQRLARYKAAKTEQERKRQAKLAAQAREEREKHFARINALQRKRSQRQEEIRKKQAWLASPEYQRQCRQEAEWARLRDQAQVTTNQSNQLWYEQAEIKAREEAQRLAAFQEQEKARQLALDQELAELYKELGGP